jgi:hypothetical protein
MGQGWRRGEKTMRCGASENSAASEPTWTTTQMRITQQTRALPKAPRGAGQAGSTHSMTTEVAMRNSRRRERSPELSPALAV